MENVYNIDMKNNQKTHTPQKTAKERLMEGIHLHEIEGNPLTSEEVELLLRFEHENWPYEKRIEYIRNTALNELVQSTEE